MEANEGFEIEGLDAYPTLRVRRRFPTKKHMLVECPRRGGMVDVVFSRKGNPMCLQILDKDECDFCWAYNLIHKKDVPEPLRLQVLEEASYWQSLRKKYSKG